MFSYYSFHYSLLFGTSLYISHVLQKQIYLSKLTTNCLLFKFIRKLVTFGEREIPIQLLFIIGNTNIMCFNNVNSHYFTVLKHLESLYFK